MKKVAILLLILAPAVLLAQFQEVQYSGGLLSTNTVSFTRPSNGTAYSPGDAITNSATATSFLAFPVSRTSGEITAMSLMIDTAEVVDSLRLWIFSDTLDVTKPNDNAAFKLYPTVSTQPIGYIDFSCDTVGANSDCAYSLKTDLKIPFLSQTVKYFYGLLEFRGATYDPNEGRIYRFKYFVKY